MRVQNIYETVANVKEQLQVELSHRYVQQFIPHPVIDENKLLYICSFLNSVKVDESEQHKYVFPLMLIQIALDTHDLVSIQTVGSDNQLLKERQLTVLAGDYYSGLYYHSLAKTENVPLIKGIASATKDINVAKIQLYRQSATDLNDIVKSFFICETALIACLCDHFQQDKWKELLRNISFISGIVREVTNGQNGKESLLLHSLKSMESKGEELRKLFDPYIYESQEVIKKYLHSENGLNKELIEHFGQLIRTFERL